MAKNYVKEYNGHKVPAGAVYYAPSTTFLFEGFYDSTKRRIARVCDGILEPARLGHESTRNDLVELPLAEPKYLPKVGEECEISNCGRAWEWCRVSFIGNSLCVVDHETHSEQHYHLSSVEFRPIKPERDSTIEKALELACVGDRAWMGRLYDEGMLRLPSEEPKPEGPPNIIIKGHVSKEVT